MSKRKDFLNLKYLANRIWGLIRNQIVARRHKRIAEFWHPIIVDYFDGKIERNSLYPKKHIGEKVIWQYWGQQADDVDLPALVQRCFDSVDRYKGDYQVVRLNDKTISDYLDFPDFIYNTEIACSSIWRVGNETKPIPWKQTYMKHPPTGRLPPQKTKTLKCLLPLPTGSFC